MGLVIQDGKLLIKPMLDGDGNPVLDGNGNPKNALATATRPSEACDCCDTPVVGKCCSYPYSNSGPQVANTAAEAIQLASQSASANSAAIPNSIWTVGTPEGVPWVEGEAWYDSARNQYECTGYWTTTGTGVTCENEYEDTCLGPFKYFISGETCEGADQCPEYPPDPDDCGYCLEYRNSPGNATLTVANNCVTRQWCQDIFDSGQYCEFNPNECMEPGGADQVFDRSLCEEGSLPCCSHEPPAGRCCVYTGQQFTQGCGDTREECIADAQSEAGSVENGYFDENDITFDPDPDADCPYSVAVYEYIPEADTPVCWDEDEDGNPVTKDFCDALKTPDVFKAEFTAGENCGEDNSGSGTCQSAPNRSNPLP